MHEKAVIVTAIFIVADIISGFIKALYNGEYKSRIMCKGLFHKVGELLVLGFGFLCEFSFPIVGITIELPIVSSLCIYIVLMETGSILENIMAISPELAEIIGKIFAGYGDKNDE